MTHDTHATSSSRQTGRRPLRPDLGRPSLFADFDQESVEDIEPQRIRLLSTLESQRGVRARPRAQRLPTGRNHPWLTRALMVAMGLGMLVMLLSFIQLLRRPPAELQIPQANAAAAPTAPLSARANPPVSPAEAAEIIDMSPPAGGGAQSTVVALSPSSSPAATGASAPAALAAHSSAMPVTGSRSTASTVTESERVSRAVKPVAQRPVARRDAGALHEDVALVEAMLAHAGPRKAPPPPTVALQQCGTGSSPETAVCRARICVQHPSLPACHTP